MLQRLLLVLLLSVAAAGEEGVEDQRFEPLSRWPSHLLCVPLTLTLTLTLSPFSPYTWFTNVQWP